MAEEIDALKAELAAAKEATPGHTDGEKRMHALVTQAYFAQQEDLESLERSPAYQLTTVQLMAFGNAHAAAFRWKEDFEELTTLLTAAYIIMGDTAYQILRGPGNARVDRANFEQPDTWNPEDFVFKLPGPSTVRSYLPTPDKDAGNEFVTKANIDTLKARWRAVHGSRRHRGMKKAGFFAWDGMYLVKGMMFNKRLRQYVGRVKPTSDEDVLTHAEIDGSELANEVIQLFWISHCGKVQVPMGFHFVNAIDSDELGDKLFDAYLRLDAAGFITLGGFTDGAASMKKAQRRLKECVEEAGGQYDAFIDYDHWTKCGRGAVWHKELYNGRGVIDGDGHFFSFETLRSMKASKVPAVAALFAHLTHADLNPQVDEMMTQLALNVIGPKVIDALKTVETMLRANEPIGCDVTLGSVESLREYLELLAAVDSAFRESKPLVTIEAALKELHDYLTDNTAIVAALSKTGACVRLVSATEWRDTADAASNQRYCVEGGDASDDDDDADADDGAEAGEADADAEAGPLPGSKGPTFKPVTKLDASTTVLAARHIRKRGKAADADRLEYLVRNPSLEAGRPTWVPSAALPAGAVLPTPRVAQQRCPKQAANLMPKQSRRSVGWNLRSIRNVARHIEELGLGISRTRYWGTNRLENNNSLHRYSNPKQTCADYALFAVKADFLMQVESLGWFKLGPRRISYARTPDAKSEDEDSDSEDSDSEESDGEESDGEESDGVAAIARMGVIKRKRPISEVTRSTSEELSDPTAPTDAEHAAFVRQTNAQIVKSRNAPGARNLKRGGTQAGGAEAECETCAEAESCTGADCAYPTRRATHVSVEAAKAAELGKPASKLPEFAIVTCSECTSMRMHLRCLGKTVKGKLRKAADDAIRQGSAWLCVCCARRQSRRPATG
jgi:hypothetical protein